MISVFEGEKLSLAEIEAFLAVLNNLRLAGCGRAEICGWGLEGLLCHQENPLQGRRTKELLRALSNA